MNKITLFSLSLMACVGLSNLVKRLNDRDYQELIDPEIDLSKQKYNVFKNHWITPLKKSKQQ